jgi:hypothetical protein
VDVTDIRRQRGPVQAAVEDRDLVSPIAQSANDMSADEPAAAEDQNAHQVAPRPSGAKVS